MKTRLGTEPERAKRVAIKVAAIYALVAGTWILFSDRALLWISRDPARLTGLQTAKGWLFVVATAAMLAWLVHHYVTALRREDERLHKVVMSASIATGEALFRSLARNLAETLGVDCVLICELAGENRETLRSLAAHIHGEAVEGLEWRWAETPCAEVLRHKGLHCLPSGVRRHFPDVPLLEEWRVESFLGTPLIDSEGRTVGVMLLMDGAPLSSQPLAEGIFPFFAMRAAVELDRMRGAEALQESERKLSTLMTNLPGMAYRCRNDRNWTMEFVSGGFTALTGHPSRDVLGNRRLSFADLIHPQDRERVWKQVQAGLSERAPFQVEYRIRTAGGEERWVWEQGQGVFAEDDTLLALEGFITDISERKASEEARARLAAIVASSDDAIISKTLDGTIVDWNAGAGRIYGYAAEEIVGRPITVLALAEHRERAQKIREQIGRGEAIDHYETVHLRKDGRPVHVSLTVSPIRDASGRLIGSSTTARDISRRKALEAALHSQFEQITAIFDALDAVVYAADLETSELLYLNRYGISVFREDWQGRTCCEVLHIGEAGPCESCPGERLVHDGEPQPPCHWESHNPTTGRWYRCTDKAIRWSDGRLVRLGIAFDITEIKSP